MKYIVFRNKLSNGLVRETPVYFPDDLIHEDVARALIQNCSQLHGASPVGAGFISCTAMNNPGCHGKSETLGIKSRGKADDHAFIMRDYHHGIIDL